tara:strand:+ start:1635 stop:1850 length:216 start_codon:yes stop_codon:yes gene_type:complete
MDRLRPLHLSLEGLLGEKLMTMTTTTMMILVKLLEQIQIQTTMIEKVYYFCTPCFTSVCWFSMSIMLFLYD